MAEVDKRGYLISGLGKEDWCVRKSDGSLWGCVDIGSILFEKSFIGKRMMIRMVNDDYSIAGVPDYYSLKSRTQVGNNKYVNKNNKTWWYIKYRCNSGGVVHFKHIYFPANFIGKNVKFKIEIIADAPVNLDEIEIPWCYDEVPV